MGEKVPKSRAGRRYLIIPPLIKDDIVKAMEGKGKKEKMVPLSPSQISDSFETMIKVSGIPMYTFHTFHHYYASLMLVNNVPNKYSM